MKQLTFLILLFNITILSAQASWQAKLYHSVAPLDRTTLKISTSYHHDYTGISHLSLVFEDFTLGSHSAYSWGVETGYTFDNIGKKKRLEFGPIINMSMMHYNEDSNWRLQMGIDVGYRLNANWSLNTSIVGGKENHHESPALDIRKNRYILSLGISFRPYFFR